MFAYVNNRMLPRILVCIYYVYKPELCQICDHKLLDTYNRFNQLRMVRLLFISMLVTIVVMQFLVERVSSVCCNSKTPGVCDDDTWGTPCCGYRKCNIFCCACKGGCRSKKRVFEDMLTQFVDDAKESRQLQDSGNEDDVQEQREVDDGDYSACKRQCL